MNTVVDRLQGRPAAERWRDHRRAERVLVGDQAERRHRGRLQAAQGGRRATGRARVDDPEAERQFRTVEAVQVEIVGAAHFRRRRGSRPTAASAAGPRRRGPERRPPAPAPAPPRPQPARGVAGNDDVGRVGWTGKPCVQPGRTRRVTAAAAVPSSAVARVTFGFFGAAIRHLLSPFPPRAHGSRTVEHVSPTLRDHLQPFLFPSRSHRDNVIEQSSSTVRPKRLPRSGGRERFFFFYLYNFPFFTIKNQKLQVFSSETTFVPRPSGRGVDG